MRVDELIAALRSLPARAVVNSVDLVNGRVTVDAGPLSRLESECAAAFGVTVEQMRGRTYKRDVVDARTAMVHALHLAGWSVPQIHHAWPFRTLEGIRYQVDRGIADIANCQEFRQIAERIRFSDTVQPINA